MTRVHDFGVDLHFESGRSARIGPSRLPLFGQIRRRMVRAGADQIRLWCELGKPLDQLTVRAFQSP